MKLIITIIFSFTLSFMALAQNHLHDIIYLKNGDKISGEIVEQQAGDYVIIKVANGSKISINSSEIELITSKKHILRDDNKYMAFAIGLGNSYGYPGLRFQQRFGGDIGYGYHAGVGVFGLAYEEGMMPWFNAGIQFFWYKGFYLDATFGTFEKNYYSTGYEVEYGPSLLIGCNYFFHPYMGINAAIGVSSNIDKAKIGIDYLAFDLGFIIKLKKLKK